MSGLFILIPERNLDLLIKNNFSITLSTFYTQKSTRIFSILFSIHFLRCLHREFVKQSRASLVGDHIFYSRDLNFDSGMILLR